MNEELRRMLQSMFAALESMRDSIVASNNTVTASNPILQQAIKTNNYLSDISDTLRQQLEFFRAADREREFEADQAKAKGRSAAPADTGSKDIQKADGKVGGFLSSIGIGIGAIAQGLTLFANPKILLGILNLSAFVGAMGIVLGLLIRYFGEDIAQFLRDILFAIGAAIVDVGIMIGENKDVLMDANEVVADFVGKMLKEFSTFLKDIMPVLVGIIEVFLDFIKDFFVDVVKAIEPIIARLLDTFDNIVNALPEIIRALTPIISRILDSFDNLVDGIVRIVELLRDPLLQIIELFNNLITSVRGMVGDIAEVFQSIIGEVRPVLQEIGNIIETIGGEIEDIVRAIGDSISGVFDSVFGANENSGLQGVINSFGSNLGELVDKALGGIEGIIETIGEQVRATLSSVTENIKDLAEIDGDSLRDTAGGIIAIAGAIAAFAGASVMDAAGNVITGVTGGISKLFGGEGSIFERLKAFKDIGPGINEAADAINNLRRAIERFSGFNIQETGLSNFADDLYDNATNIRKSMDTILGEGGFLGFGKGPGSVDERLELLRTLGELSGGGVTGSPVRTGVADRSAEASLEAARAAAEAMNPVNALSNVESASNNTNSFNTNQLFITTPGGAEATLDRLILADQS